MARNRLFVLGVDIYWNSIEGDFAVLNISRPLRELDINKKETGFKMTRRTLGESGDVSQYDKPIRIDHEYALKLEKVGALVPRREYEFDLDLNPLDPLAGSIVTKLIPVDPEIKKHFEASLGEKQGA
ncbi:DUF1293 family protein [Vibrio sp. CJQ_6]|uniref:DUF1293 family protein n=1 Tax=Vibrio sp. CJQ_6 TaxID=3367165 RepID=UPI00370A7661